MKQKIALAQCTSFYEEQKNLDKAEIYIKSAKNQGAELIVFPEYFMTYYPVKGKSHVKKAQSVTGAFATAMGQLAQYYGIWVVFGMNEAAENKAAQKSYNTILVMDDEGRIQGKYQKTHLFDAFHWKESKDTLPGKELFSPIESPVGIIGIGVCYDLRFPELARNAALHGAKVMLYPSAWVKGDGKFRQWKALLQARAIENGCFVLGCCHYSKEHYMGRSLAISPTGEILKEGKEQEELILCEIDLAEEEKIRTEVPVLKNRRADLYCSPAK